MTPAAPGPVLTSPAPRAPSRRRWVLPDDGIIDPIAIEIAATGARPVALTRPERRLAAELILAAGGTPHLISRRLHMNNHQAHALAAAIRAESASQGAARREAA